MELEYADGIIEQDTVQASERFLGDKPRTLASSRSARPCDVQIAGLVSPPLVAEDLHAADSITAILPVEGVCPARRDLLFRHVRPVAPRIPDDSTDRALDAMTLVYVVSAHGAGRD